MIRVRPLTRDEFGKVAELNVTEEGDVVFKWCDGRLVAVPSPWRRLALTALRVQEIVAEWPAIVQAGGAVLGALDGDRLAGVGVVVPHLTAAMAQLFYLHVSRPYRRQGVARSLLAEVIRRARAGGARELYVSATPSSSALGFYQNAGFRPVAHPHPRLLALEPEDIHMSLPL